MLINFLTIQNFASIFNTSCSICVNFWVLSLHSIFDIDITFPNLTMETNQLDEVKYSHTATSLSDFSMLYYLFILCNSNRCNSLNSFEFIRQNIFTYYLFAVFIAMLVILFSLSTKKAAQICNKNVASDLASHFGKRICSPSNLRYCLWFHSISNRECLTSFQTSLDKTFFKSFPNCITYFPLNVMGYIVPTPEKNPWLDCVLILRHASDKTFY